MAEDESPQSPNDLEALDRATEEALAGPNPKLTKRQHRLGKLLVRERIASVLDEDSFVELGMLAKSTVASSASREDTAWGDGVVTGTGTVEGRPVAIYAHDPTVMRGSLGVTGATKICRILELARDQRLPVLALHDSDGVRLGEGARALKGFGEVLGHTARLSGHVPQIGVVLGLCVGGSAYSSALQDIIIGHREHGFLFVTGAKVTRVVTGAEDPIEELGGVPMHEKTTGLVHLGADDDAACLALARQVLSYLPDDSEDFPSEIPTQDSPKRSTPKVTKLVPESARRAYDMRKVLKEVFDQDSVLELQPNYARSIVVAFARLAGQSVGVVASQPMHDAGCLDVDSSRKGARFIQLCNAYNLPIITLADTPGFRPGLTQEQGGLLLHGAKLISAYSACEVPLVSLILRKSYGGANVLALPADIRLAFPYARVQPMGIDAALEVVKHSSFGELEEGALEKFEADFRASYDTTTLAAEAGFVDRIIHPDDTRRELCAALRSLSPAPARGGIPEKRLTNIPL